MYSEGSSLLSRLDMENLDGVSFDVEEPEVEEPLRERIVGDTVIRPLGIFMSSNALANLSTAEVLKLLSSQVVLGGRPTEESDGQLTEESEEPTNYSTESLPKPVLLEWIDDKSIVLLYDSIQDSTTSCFFLTGIEVNLEESDPTKLREMLKFLSLESEFSFSGRMALESDVVAHDAAAKSNYYKRNGRPAPYDATASRWQKNSESNDRRGGRKERSQVSNGTKSQTAQELDDELDAYLKGK